MRKSVLFVSVLGLLTGCALGTTSYSPPAAYGHIENEKIINRPIDEVWASAIPSLGKDFFVINNIDKDSGLINLSYNGNPEKYLDCGTVEAEVSNARGKRNYHFNAASPHQRYEIFDQGMLFGVTRKMDLNGRINLIFEEIDPSQTKATANVRYAVTKKVHATPVAGGYPLVFDDTITFDSNSSARFPGKEDEQTRCVSNGKLEKEVLSLIQ